MNPPSRYLDYAATSAIRPPEVIDAMTRYMREVGATPGRSGHARSVEAGRMALRCRTRLAELLGVQGDPGRIVFQLNATHALNTAILGTLQPGDRVIRTAYDHNATRRPIAAACQRGAVESVLPIGASGSPDLDQLRELLATGSRPARLLVLPHASNVTGAVLPVRRMAELAHEHGTAVLLDAAQTVGHFPVDVRELAVDMLAFTGHKGVPGPQGVGGLWVGEGIIVEPLLYGGTGGDSAPPDMPDAYPDHLEAGTQNAVGIAGLAAAAAWVLARGVPALHAAEAELKRSLVSGLQSVPGVTICPPSEASEMGIVTLLFGGMDPGALASELERTHGIQGRAGLHCAPDAHRAMGTLATGAYRLSLGWASTSEDVMGAVEAFRDLSRIRKGF